MLICNFITFLPILGALDGSAPSDSSSSGPAESKRGAGLTALWIARDRFAVLDRSHTVLIKSLKNEVVKTLALSTGRAAAVDEIFYAGTGMLLLRDVDGLVLYDVQQGRELATVSCPKVKQVLWNADLSAVCLLSKHQLTIANRRLEVREFDFYFHLILLFPWFYFLISNFHFLSSSGYRNNHGDGQGQVCRLGRPRRRPHLHDLESHQVRPGHQRRLWHHSNS